MIKILPISLTVLLLAFAGCASSGSGSTEQRGSSDMPSWFLVPPTSEDVLYGVGQAKKQNPSLAKSAATARARTEISQGVNVKVSSMMKDFMSESGIGENAQALEFSEAVTKQVTDNALAGSVIKEAYVAKDGTVYILVEYPLNSIKQNALDAVKKEEALYNEFKANQSFDDLEDSIKNL
jgi:hypothetical protein